MYVCMYVYPLSLVTGKLTVNREICLSASPTYLPIVEMTESPNRLLAIHDRRRVLHFANRLHLTIVEHHFVARRDRRLRHDVVETMILEWLVNE